LWFIVRCVTVVKLCLVL